jgi:hypothetical protein
MAQAMFGYREIRSNLLAMDYGQVPEVPHAPMNDRPKMLESSVVRTGLVDCKWKSIAPGFTKSGLAVISCAPEGPPAVPYLSL